MKQFKTESKRVLDLMINSIYTNRDIFLRELVSNASDAIDKLKFISLTDDKVDTNFEIVITCDKNERKITIADNGIGMTKEDLEDNLGTIAKSGTLKFKRENDGSDKELIGQFGVGFYSAFTVAKRVQVISKAYGSDVAYMWESSGVEGYTVTETTKDAVGSTVILYLKDDEEDLNYSEFLESYKITGMVKKYLDYIRYPIKTFVTRSVKKEGSSEDKPEYEEVTELQTLNSMIPLWKRPKTEVKEQDLTEFYKNEFADYSEPLKSVYAKIEGTVSYDTLFFIPKKAPYDYYSKDYKKGLKLYSNGVLIMENCEEILPEYLSFVKGIIDSSDITLNLSREVLQQDRQLKAIATSLEKKIFSELKKMQDTEPEKYAEFFNEFGLKIKFGVYDMFGMNKDKLKDYLMFYSSTRQKLISLKEYVSLMAEDQKCIYYAVGESYEKIGSMPQIEKASDKGIEILYFKDGVDEFVAKILNEYDGKPFKSITDADFSLDTEEEKKALEEKKDSLKDMLDYVLEKLNGKVKEVRLSNKLKSYPVCLTSAGALSIEMEKVLKSVPNGNENVSAEKVLEINSEHKILEKLSALFESDKEKLDKYITVLYEQARLLEGLGVENLKDYIMAMSDIM